MAAFSSRGAASPAPSSVCDLRLHAARGEIGLQAGGIELARRGGRRGEDHHLARPSPAAAWRCAPRGSPPCRRPRRPRRRRPPRSPAAPPASAAARRRRSAGRSRPAGPCPWPRRRRTPPRPTAGPAAPAPPRPARPACGSSSWRRARRRQSPRAAFAPSAAASRMASTALACTPPMKPSPIQGIRSATSGGAWTQASSASNGSASAAAAATTCRSPSPPDSGAMILAQIIAFLRPRVHRRRHAAPRIDICQAIGHGAARPCGGSTGPGGSSEHAWREALRRRRKPKRRGPGSGCCPAAGSTCSTPPRSTSRSRTSPTASPGWRAGTARPSATTPFRSPSIRWWSRRSPPTSSPALEPRWRLAALLHDAPEYVIGDMISPFKAALGLDYRIFEERLETAIHLRFGLPARVPGGDQGADQDRRPRQRLLRGDADRRLQPRREPRACSARRRRATGSTIEPMSASAAQARYLDRYHVLAEAAGFTPAAQAFDTE